MLLSSTSASTGRSTPIASSPTTRTRPSASSRASTAPSYCTMRRRSSPTAASSAWAPRSASPPAGCMPAGPSAWSSSPRSSMSCGGRARCGRVSAQSRTAATRWRHYPQRDKWHQTKAERQLVSSPAPPVQPLDAASALDQTYDNQEDNRTDHGVDDLGDEAAADVKADARQQPPGDHRADNADHDVADQPESATLDDLTGEPAGNSTNDEPNDDDFRRHGLSFPVGPRACLI